MLGKARPADWYNAVMAFNRSYQPLKPVQTQNPAAGDKPIIWETYLNVYGRESAVNNEVILELYAFVHAFTGNNSNNFHPTLNLQALFSESAKEELRKIREASTRGKNAAAQFRDKKPLEAMIK